MPSEQLLRRTRWAAVLLCVSTVLVSVSDMDTQTGIGGLLPRPLLFCFAIAYAALLLILLRPSLNPSHSRWMAALMLCSVPLDFDNLAALNLFALPFVAARSSRRPWIWAQAAVFLVQLLFGWLKLADPAQWERFRNFPPAELPALYLALGTGILQCIVWGGFAYLIGSLLVQLEMDRMLVTRANAELRGAQTMLAETARIEERLKISRELHDSVGHYLTSLNLQLEIISNVAGTDAQKSLERARLLVRLLLAEVREAASDWRLERSEALPAAIRELCEGVSGLDIKLDLATDLPPANPGTSHALFRIVQESLTNTLRHAKGARTFSVILGRASSGGFELRISDDGAGTLRMKPGSGIQGMRDRVRELAGTLDIESSGGFRIHVTLPAAAGRSLAP
jgi:signal transduction histidine kinase